jgi:hypothetical protein
MALSYHSGRWLEVPDGIRSNRAAPIHRGRAAHIYISAAHWGPATGLRSYNLTAGHAFFAGVEALNGISRQSVYDSGLGNQTWHK